MKIKTIQQTKQNKIKQKTRNKKQKTKNKYNKQNKIK
jgi:DNA replication protein DnaD